MKLAALIGAVLVLSPAATAQTPVPNCVSVTTFADGRSPQRVRHVAVNGDDARGNGSATSPFKTIGRAARDITPGTAIQLHAGIHAGGAYLTNLQGTSSEPIWIMGAPGESRPVIEGGGEGLKFVKPGYVVVQNLEIRGTADSGINADDGDDVTNPEAARGMVFRDLDVHDTGRRASGVPNCLKLAGVNDVVIINSRFARCGNGPESGAVGVGGVGVQRATVAFNDFSENGYGGIQFKGGSSNVTIAGNRFTNTGWRGVNMGGSTGAAFFRPPPSRTSANAEARHLRVVGNFFAGSEAAAAFTGCVDCEFSHNTVVNPSKWALRVLQETVELPGYAVEKASRGVIADNVFFFRRADLNAGEDINIGPHTDWASFSVNRNAWRAHDLDRSATVAVEQATKAAENRAFFTPAACDAWHR